MPRITNTRKQKAEELLRLAEKGPSFTSEIPNWALKELPSYDYKLWAESWLIPIIKELVPELRKK